MATAFLSAALLLAACTNGSDSPSPGTDGEPVAPPTTDGARTTVEPTSTSQVNTPSTTETQRLIEVGATVEGEGTLTATVLRVLPHDFEAQTQGLAWNGTALIESIGVYGNSGRRLLSPTSAQTSQEKFLQAELFATDVAVVGDTGIQLSAREGIAFAFSIDNLNESRRILVEGEGWGVCFDGESLVTTDNTNLITRRNPDTLEVISSQELEGDQEQLRALECSQDLLWAVSGDTNRIVAVDLAGGDVVGVLDLGELVPPTAGPNDDLTAVAFNPAAETYFVAGRRWGVFYELKIERPLP